MKSSAHSDETATSLPAFPLRLGIIGCGGILRKIYSEILAGLREQAKVVALCDLSEASLKQVGRIFPEARLYQRISAMLEREKLDAVMVLSSETANARITIEVLAAGIPVYLEKPPALTLEEFDRLREAEKRSEAPLFVSFNRRHTPMLQGVDLPVSPVRIAGQMMRLGREVSDFPYTGLHLLDSLLYFTQATPNKVRVEFMAEPVPTWRLNCLLDGTCVTSIELIPDGGDHREYMQIVAKDESMEIQFPNPESHYSEGQVTRVRKGQCQVFSGEEGISPHEQMGYAPSLRGFLKHVAAGDQTPDIYSLSSSRSAIAIMEAMMDAYLTEMTPPEPANASTPSEQPKHESR